MILKEKIVGIIGLLSTFLVMLSIVIFGFLNKEFSFQDDFISKLGANGAPNALWFNLIGFVLVGLLLTLFGFFYGRLLKDKLLSFLLAMFGLGFTFTAIPTEIEASHNLNSKIHVISICLGLAFWLFGLSRLSYNKLIRKKIRNRANFTAIVIVLSIIGFVLGFWSMPITHRLVFGIVFGWTAITSTELIFKKI